MTKIELLKKLEPFDNDIEIWMEVDAGIAHLGFVDPHQDDGEEYLVLAPLSVHR